MTKKVEDGGDEPHQGQDKRYCKQAEGQILISRFHLITKYNEGIGGVDLLDRMVALCRCTSKKNE